MGFSQNDPSWKNLILGGGPDTVGNDGCYLTSFAMEATWMGQSINPAQLNSEFKNAGIFGAGCAECLPDNALARLFPNLCRLANVWKYGSTAADLSKLNTSGATTFKCVELQLGPSSFHFAPVVDGTKGAQSTILDPWPYPSYVRPISAYGDPATIIVKITENDWITPAPQPPPAPLNPEGYWPGWDIARGLVMLNATDGVKLDGWGGLHAVGSAPQPRATAYWQGWDIARDLALNPDRVTGYVLDGWGGLHSFALGSTPPPPNPTITAYWKGWDIARRVVVTAQGQGFVMDGWGGRHSFSTP